MTANYAKLLKQITLMQSELMEIDNYSEKAYQLMEQLIDELDYQSEEVMKEVVIGVYPISNFGGIEILEINDINDTVKWRYNFGEPLETQESDISYYFKNGKDEKLRGFFGSGTFIEISEILKVG